MDPYAALLILASFFLGFFVGLMVGIRRHLKDLEEISHDLRRCVERLNNELEGLRAF